MLNLWSTPILIVDIIWLSSDWFQSCSHIFDIRKWYTAARSIRLIKIRFILWNLLSPDHHHFSWRPMFIKIDLRCNHKDNYSINEHRENKTKPNRIYLLVCISEPMSNSYTCIASVHIVLLWKCFPVSHRWGNIVGKSPAELHVGHIYQRKKITKESQIASVTPSKRVLWNAFHLKEQKSFLWES